MEYGTKSRGTPQHLENRQTTMHHEGWLKAQKKGAFAPFFVNVGVYFL